MSHFLGFVKDEFGTFGREGVGDDKDDDDDNPKWPLLDQFSSYDLQILHHNRSKWYLQDDDDENPKWP